MNKTFSGFVARAAISQGGVPMCIPYRALRLSSAVLGLFVLISSFAAAQVGVWTPKNEGLFGAWTLALATSSDGVSYAGTNFGVFRSSDGGQTWVQLGVNASANAVAVNPGDPSIVFAGTEGRGIYRTTNSGDTWIMVNSGLTDLNVQALAIDPQSTQTIYAATRGGGVYRSTDNGANWAQNNGGLNSLDVRALAIDPGTPGVILAGAQDGVYRSTDEGANWTPIKTNLEISSLLIIPSVSPTLLAGARDGAYRSLDGGSTWTKPLNTGTNGVVRALAIDPIFPNTVYAGVFCNGIFKSTDGGAQWIHVPSFNGCVSALSMDSTNMYAGSWGNPNALFASSDGGTTWEATSLFAVPVVSLSVNPADTNTVYAGTMNDLFTSGNGGDNWFRIPSSITHVRAIVSDPQSPNTIYVGGERGDNVARVFRSRDGGSSWENVTHEIATTNVYALALSPGSPDILYAGTPIGVYRSTDEGDTWANVTNGINPAIWALAVGPQNIVYAGTDKGIFKSTSAGDQWETPGLAPSRINAIAVDPWCPDVVYAVTNGPGVRRSLDGGHSWQPIINSLNLGGIQSVAVNASAPNVIYARTNAGVARSEDFGENWTAYNQGLNNIGGGPLLVVAKYPGPSTVFVAGMNHVFSAEFMDVPYAVLTWANPADIVYGTPLGAGQLNATANVPGTFVYTLAAGTILNAGNGQTLSVKFTPAGASDCYSVGASVRINVLTAGQATTNLTAALSALSLPTNIVGELKASLDAAAAAFARGNQTAGANQLAAFQNKVQAQAGKKIDQATAAALIAAAQQIITAVRGH
jgi:photosystem II stability/assembly factor-like uncharacterized protein